MGNHAPASEFCYNCGIRLSGSYCAACGQKSRELNPTFVDLLHDLTNELLNVDGKTFRSVGALLARPGVLTKDYFEGRRARWISPLRLYLLFSVAYFGLPALLGTEGAEEMQAAGRAMFALLPLFAWFVSLVARGHKNFPQHLYFALHVHAAWLAAWLIRELGAEILSPRLMSSTRWLGHLAMLYSVVYVVVAFKTAYQERFWRAALKMLGVGVAYAVSLMGVLVAYATFVRRGVVSICAQTKKGDARESVAQPAVAPPALRRGNLGLVTDSTLDC